MELMRFVLDGTEVRYGHWEVGLNPAPLFCFDCFHLLKFLPQWNHGSEVGLL